MSTQDEAEKVKTAGSTHPGSCRIKTEGGTVYWISAADSEGKHWVVRDHEHDSETNTMVMQPIESSKDGLDFGEKFKARLGGSLVVGRPFLLELDEHETRILSEIITSIEVGNVPDVFFE